jgi:hypothetical protein
MATAGFDLLRRSSTILQWLEAHRWRVLAVTLPLVLLLHLIFATVTIRRSNLEWRPSDQLAENYLAAAARYDPLPARTDGVRNPLWSWTVSHFYHDDREVTFFTRGKWLNTVFCLMFLGALGLGVARWLDPLATVNLLLLSSLGILLVRGAYFQPEPLYYIFLFLSGVLAFCILRGPRWWHFPVFGVTCGLAYLAKASLLPFLFAFGAAFGLRGIRAVFRRGDPGWNPWKNLPLALLAGGIFTILLIPLARYTTEHYGKPLFNYPKYWMWMDDFETEAFPFEVKHPGKLELEKIPPDDLPGPAWYFRRHSVSDAFQRAVRGAQKVVARFFLPEEKLRGQAFFWRWSPRHWRQPLAHRGVYLVLLAVLCAALAWPVRREIGQRLREPGPLSCAFLVVCATGLYVGLYGWYYPVGKGDRFMGSLWVPSVFLLCWTAFRLRQVSSPRWRDAAYLGMHALIFLSLLLQISCIAWHFSQGAFLATRN